MATTTGVTVVVTDEQQPHRQKHRPYPRGENNLPLAELQGHRRQFTCPHRPTQRPMEATPVKLVNYECPDCGRPHDQTRGAEVHGTLQIQCRGCQNVEAIDRTGEPAL